MIKQETQEPSGSSGRLRSFFEIVDNGDGTADIYFDKGTAFPLTDELTGASDVDILCRVMKGVELFDGIENDIRERYESWYASAEVIWL
jgi:hypothetical protein